MECMGRIEKKRQNSQMSKYVMMACFSTVPIDVSIFTNKPVKLFNTITFRLVKKPRDQRCNNNSLGTSYLQCSNRRVVAS